MLAVADELVAQDFSNKGKRSDLAQRRQAVEATQGVLRHSQFVIAHGGFQPLQYPLDHVRVGFHGSTLSITRAAEVVASSGSRLSHQKDKQLPCRCFASDGVRQQTIGDARLTPVGRMFMASANVLKKTPTVTNRGTCCSPILVRRLVCGVTRAFKNPTACQTNCVDCRSARSGSPARSRRSASTSGSMRRGSRGVDGTIRCRKPPR